MVRGNNNDNIIILHHQDEMIRTIAFDNAPVAAQTSNVARAMADIRNQRRKDQMKRETALWRKIWQEEDPRNHRPPPSRRREPSVDLIAIEDEDDDNEILIDEDPYGDDEYDEDDLDEAFCQENAYPRAAIDPRRPFYASTPNDYDRRRNAPNAHRRARRAVSVSPPPRAHHQAPVHLQKRPHSNHNHRNPPQSRYNPPPPPRRRHFRYEQVDEEEDDDDDIEFIQREPPRKQTIITSRRTPRKARTDCAAPAVNPREDLQRRLEASGRAAHLVTNGNDYRATTLNQSNLNSTIAGNCNRQPMRREPARIANHLRDRAVQVTDSLARPVVHQQPRPPRHPLSSNSDEEDIQLLEEPYNRGPPPQIPDRAQCPIVPGIPPLRERIRIAEIAQRALTGGARPVLRDQRQHRPAPRPSVDVVLEKQRLVTDYMITPRPERADNPYQLRPDQHRDRRRHDEGMRSYPDLADAFSKERRIRDRQRTPSPPERNRVTVTADVHPPPRCQPVVQTTNEYLLFAPSRHRSPNRPGNMSVSLDIEEVSDRLTPTPPPLVIEDSETPLMDQTIRETNNAENARAAFDQSVITVSQPMPSSTAHLRAVMPHRPAMIDRRKNEIRVNTLLTTTTENPAMQISPVRKEGGATPVEVVVQQQQIVVRPAQSQEGAEDNETPLGSQSFFGHEDEDDSDPKSPVDREVPIDCSPFVPLRLQAAISDSINAITSSTCSITKTTATATTILDCSPVASGIHSVVLSSQQRLLSTTRQEPAPATEIPVPGKTMSNVKPPDSAVTLQAQGSAVGFNEFQNRGTEANVERQPNAAMGSATSASNSTAVAASNAEVTTASETATTSALLQSRKRPSEPREPTIESNRAAESEKRFSVDCEKRRRLSQLLHESPPRSKLSQLLSILAVDFSHHEDDDDDTLQTTATSEAQMSRHPEFSKNSSVSQSELLEALQLIEQRQSDAGRLEPAAPESVPAPEDAQQVDQVVEQSVLFEYDPADEQKQQQQSPEQIQDADDEEDLHHWKSVETQTSQLILSPLRLLDPVADQLDHTQNIFSPILPQLHVDDNDFQSETDECTAEGRSVDQQVRAVRQVVQNGIEEQLEKTINLDMTQPGSAEAQAVDAQQVQDVRIVRIDEESLDEDAFAEKLEQLFNDIVTPTRTVDDQPAGEVEQVAEEDEHSEALFTALEQEQLKEAFEISERILDDIIQKMPDNLSVTRIGEVANSLSRHATSTSDNSASFHTTATSFASGVFEDCQGNNDEEVPQVQPEQCDSTEIESVTPGDGRKTGNTEPIGERCDHVDVQTAAAGQQAHITENFAPDVRPVADVESDTTGYPKVHSAGQLHEDAQSTAHVQQVQSVVYVPVAAEPTITNETLRSNDLQNTSEHHQLFVDQQTAAEVQQVHDSETCPQAEAVEAFVEVDDEEIRAAERRHEADIEIAVDQFHAELVPDEDSCQALTPPLSEMVISTDPDNNAETSCLYETDMELASDLDDSESSISDTTSHGEASMDLVDEPEDDGDVDDKDVDGPLDLTVTSPLDLTVTASQNESKSSDLLLWHQGRIDCDPYDLQWGIFEKFMQNRQKTEAISGQEFQETMVKSRFILEAARQHQIEFLRLLNVIRQNRQRFDTLQSVLDFLRGNPKLCKC